MDKQFSVSLFEPTARTNSFTSIMIVDFGNPVSRDYAEWLKSTGGSITALSMSEKSTKISSRESKLVVFIRGQLQNKIDVVLLALVKKYGIKDVSIVSSFQSYFTNEKTIKLEKSLLRSLEEADTKAIIFRCGHIISDRSVTKKNLERFAFLSPLIPRYLRSCCIEGKAVFQAIDTEQNSASRRSRIIALLGANQPWEEFLQDNSADSSIQIALRGFSSLLNFLLVGHFVALLLNWLIKLKLLPQSWNLQTIEPQSMGELLSFINKYNYKYVKVVGYNNSTNHFGSRNWGKTVISTVNCDRIIRTSEKTVKVDCGATVLQTLNFLAEKQQELCSIPNYSYVSMGTTFFVPIHGNSLDSTIAADNIIKVILYEPKQERFIITSRGEPAFQKYIFNPSSEVVLLRLYVLVKPKVRYYLHKEKLSNPSDRVLLAAFRNNTATNIDIRKSNARSESVCINKYYSQPFKESQSEELELPRDEIGKLWDKLERKPLISWLLLHVPPLYLFWNVEVFLSESEFAKFWDTHTSLPIRKVELRYKKRNQYLNSPFRESDRIAVDFIVLRKHRQAIEEYLERNFAPLHYHQGKHHKTFS